VESGRESSWVIEERELAWRFFEGTAVWKQRPGKGQPVKRLRCETRVASSTVERAQDRARQKASSEFAE